MFPFLACYRMNRYTQNCGKLNVKRKPAKPRRTVSEDVALAMIVQEEQKRSENLFDRDIEGSKRSTNSRT